MTDGIFFQRLFPCVMQKLLSDRRPTATHFYRMLSLSMFTIWRWRSAVHVYLQGGRFLPPHSILESVSTPLPVSWRSQVLASIRSAVGPSSQSIEAAARTISAGTGGTGRGT